MHPCVARNSDSSPRSIYKSLGGKVCLVPEQQHPMKTAAAGKSLGCWRRTPSLEIAAAVTPTRAISLVWVTRSTPIRAILTMKARLWWR